MAATKDKRIKIFSGVMLFIMVVLTSIVIYVLIKSDSASVSILVNAGNAWGRLLGVLIGVQVVLLLVILILKTYGITRGKAGYYLNGALISNVILIMTVLTVIYSGAARLDSEFTLDSVVSKDDVKKDIWPSDEAVSADGIVSILDCTMWQQKDENRIMVSLNVNNNTEIELLEIRYSLIAPDMKIYSGSPILEKYSLGALSSEGTHSGDFNVFLPVIIGTYQLNIEYEYRDMLGENHVLSYSTEKEVR